MTGERHCEIAGAGFAGLTAALALARRGWSVRVHERAPDLRSGGFALALHANGARVLKALGVFEAATAGTVRIGRREVRDGNNRVVSGFTFTNPMYRTARTQILNVLAQAAIAQGAEIRTGSEVVKANPDGELHTVSGETHPADLVIVADGVNSRVRDQLEIPGTCRRLSSGAMRLIVPRRPMDDALAGLDCGVEWISGRRRIIYSPSGLDEVYLALSCNLRDEAAQAVPINRISWTATFPALDALFDRLTREADWSRVRWVPFQAVRLDRWSRGRVAIVGDAATAMAPSLGQGAMTAMMNGLSLAAEVGRGNDVGQALATWEARERPLAEHTQRMSAAFGAIADMPGPFRSLALMVARKSPLIGRMITRTANHIPFGADEALT